MTDRSRKVEPPRTAYGSDPAILSRERASKADLPKYAFLRYSLVASAPTPFSPAPRYYESANRSGMIMRYARDYPHVGASMMIEVWQRQRIHEIVSHSRNSED